MIPELGQFAIILALCFALIQGLSPFFKNHFYELSVETAFGQFLFLAFAMICLIVSFVNNDLTVIYVRDHSHHLLPLMYRIGAAWGGHEGSLLLWCLMLSGWTFIFALFVDKDIPKIIVIEVLKWLGWLNAGFILFLFATSNPFARDFPTQLIVGNDLTPILQDPGLIFHPPMLYLGYVGFVIVFAVAVTALWQGKFDKVLARACKPWIILPWSFLSCGIVLGSWWAYRELGWGGWWFWDPVENASLLPWLAATALLHSLLVTEKSEAFKGWTILLAIITFGLCLLGTFLVRSGVIVSVHAFATDPTRGIYLLCYITVVMGGSLLLYSFKIKNFYRAPQFKLLSRETFLLINSVFLICVVATIVLGTLYPILLDALGLERISVGEPYFNAVFVPLMLPLLLLMGFAPHTQWQKQSAFLLWKKLRLTLLISLLLGFCLPKLLGFPFHFWASLGLSVGLWIILATLQPLLQLKKMTFSFIAMMLAHIGIAILVIGVSFNKSYSQERQVKIQVGDSVGIAGYELTFKTLDKNKGPNFESLVAHFAVQKNQNKALELTTEQRVYTSHEQTMSKAGIAVNIWRDLYVALGAPLTQKEWSVRIYYKPLVRWIWFGGVLLLLGGGMSLLTFAVRDFKRRQT